MTDWHASACVRMSECVSVCLRECRQSHPQHTNVINKVKLLLGRERAHTHLHTQTPPSMHSDTKRHEVND